MHQEKIVIQRALISVSDKSGLIDFAKALIALGIEIISTGGTYKALREASLSATEVASFTGFPEMMEGRIKTLHPKIHGGILGLRDKHVEIAKNHDIEWIDLVIVNLYPFEQTIKKPAVLLDDAIENIDVGGPAMIRAAAKNMGWVGVIVEPSDYSTVLSELLQHKGLTFETRKALAIKAFKHTASYDEAIYHYLAAQDTHRFLDSMDLHLKKWAELRYGENPHQKATAYRIENHSSGILTAKQFQGKPLSFNNITDADAALHCIEEFEEPACVIVKHGNPCGVSLAETLHLAFKKAFAADSLSAFGGIIAINGECDKNIATSISAIFFELVMATGFTKDALEIFASKPNLRVLELPITESTIVTHELRFVRGAVLMQERDKSALSIDDFNIVTKVAPTTEESSDLLFANCVVKHVKSNAIVIAKNNTTLGIGAGQVSRVDAVDIALKKAGQELAGAVLASDAFFPFRDSIDRLAGTGIRAIIQPGGSIRDEEIIEACNEHGIALVFTGVRSFKH